MLDKLKVLIDEPELFAAAIIKELNKLRDEIQTKATLSEIGTIQGERGEDGIDGRDGKDGQDGKDGINGIDGKNGRDGITGTNGKDGISGINGINGTNGKDATIDIEALMETLIEKIKKEKPIDISHIRNADSFIFGGSKYKTHELMHGAGAFSIIAVSGVIDDSNVDFVAASVPSVVVVNGNSYRNGFGATINGTTITLDTPVGTGGDIYAI